MIGVSGCFGKRDAIGPINDVDGAASAIEDIVASTGAIQEQKPSGDFELGMIADLYERRIRLLSWSVVVIAVYLVLKELKKS